MQRTMCRAKIHMATVTEANLYYMGSITVDADLMQAADLLPYERVQVVNTANGERLETYVIAGEPGSGTIALNGAAARLVQPGDRVIIMVYGIYDDAELAAFEPKVLFVDEKNRLREVRKAEPPLTIA